MIIKIPDKKGFMLIEAILALGIIVVITTSLVSALISSFNNANFSKDQNRATAYAQEGLEIVRNFKDSDYYTFSFLATGTYCLPGGATFSQTSRPGGNCRRNVASTFSREIYINQAGDDPRTGVTIVRCSDPGSVFVASVVLWSDTKCINGADCHRVELNSCFTNLNRVSGP